MDNKFKDMETKTTHTTFLMILSILKILTQIKLNYMKKDTKIVWKKITTFSKRRVFIMP